MGADSGGKKYFEKSCVGVLTSELCEIRIVNVRQEERLRDETMRKLWTLLRGRGNSVRLWIARTQGSVVWILQCSGRKLHRCMWQQ